MRSDEFQMMYQNFTAYPPSINLEPKVSLIRLSVKKSKMTFAQNARCWGHVMLLSDFSDPASKSVGGRCPRLGSVGLIESRLLRGSVDPFWGETVL